MYIERQISYLHSQVSLSAYELHKSRVRNNFRRGTVVTTSRERGKCCTVRGQKYVRPSQQNIQQGS